ncbi:MAG TPA: GTP 3',8-cyclase MoaA [Acidimicrobiales bacterium]|jgi:cyclic pyranopterin phosphate synthase|nr:GTP 3',8-cyclase MoaA [Acidimicrobiales bacterium]
MAVPLIDSYGRTVRDLRISVTDRCNFRCQYCMPEEGMVWLPREELLTFEEIERIARLCVERFSVESIRLTGGEPTVRAHLPKLVAKLSSLRVGGTPDGQKIDVAMTTNGASLRLLAEDLAEAGLRRVNISCDSLRRERFLAITKRDSLDAVLDGIESAKKAGFDPVKINCVLMRGINDDEIVDFARFGRERGVTVRFIEFMPLDALDEWSWNRVVPGAEIVAAIDAVFPMEPVPGRGSQPAERYRYRDGAGEVGVINSVSQPFCGACDRIRLTAEGQLRNCLFAVDETDLRSILRQGGTDDDVAAAIEANVARKWEGHSINKVTFIRPNRSMSQIGG